MKNRDLINILLGLVILLATVLFDSPFEGLSNEGWMTIGLGIMMALWWVTECVPIPVTAFMPLVLAPILKIDSLPVVSSSYSNPILFLFLGGFLLSLAMEESNLHRRIACFAMSVVRPSPRFQLGGIMLVTAFLSMWISNTATAVMMTPIALSVIVVLKDNGSKIVTRPMLLGVAYAASIGGVATLIGTPPNVFLAGYLNDTYGIQISFSAWMAVGLPFSIVLLSITWWWLGKDLGEELSSSASDVFRTRLKSLGTMSRAEINVGIVFGVTALLWIFRKWLVAKTDLPLTDAGISMFAGSLLFFLPGREKGERVLEWVHTKRLPWGIFMLFGGGLALAKLIQSSGLATYLGQTFMALEGMNLLVVVGSIALVVVFVTELTSNTATTAAFLPLLGPLAIAIGVDPILLAAPAAMAASCAFMMPVATPPNAIVFASGELRVSEMVRAGFFLNLVSSILLVLVAKTLLPILVGSQ